MTALDAVRQLQHDHDELLTRYTLATTTDTRDLVEENVQLKKLARTVSFLSKAYDTPEINLSCRNHVELVEYLNDALESLTVDLT